MSETMIFILGCSLFLMCMIWTVLTLYAFGGGWEEKEGKEPLPSASPRLGETKGAA